MTKSVSLLIIIFNAMIESILEVQAGVIFFAFFLAIFSLEGRDHPLVVPGSV